MHATGSKPCGRNCYRDHITITIVMGYANYILNGHPVRPEELISDRRGLRTVTTITVIPVTIIALAAMACLLPAAYGMDGGRFLRLRYYRYLGARRKERYLKGVMISLGHPAKEWIILKAA
jgi:hypothetical protein